MAEKIGIPVLPSSRHKKRAGVDDGLMRLISFLISVGLWFYVVYAENPETEIWIRNINVSVVNMENIVDNNLTLLTSDKPPVVNIKLRGRRQRLAGFTADRVSATIDLKGITEEGEYSLPIIVGALPDGVELVEKSPPIVSVKIDRVIEVFKNVNINVTGAPAEGYLMGAVTATPADVRIKGPRSDINTISSLSASIDITGATADIRQITEVVLTGSRGERLYFNNVSLSDTSVEIYCEILRRKTVPVKPGITGGDFPLGNISVSPGEVSIVGSPDAVSGIESIETQPLEPLQLTSGGSVSVGLNVPEGIRVEGNITSVQITAAPLAENTPPPGNDAP